MGYTNSADVLALRIEDDREVSKPSCLLILIYKTNGAAANSWAGGPMLYRVSLKLWNLHLFSSGAFSNVYRGFVISDTNVPKEIVIKKTWSGPREASALTCYEIQILKMLSRLNHKNVIRLLYSYRTRYSDNTCYSLIFEFFPLNLYQYLKKFNRKIGLVETKMFAWQLFRGQYHLLRAGICHRDIKPQNLLIDEESGLLKIGDFGSSAVEPRKAPQPSYHVTRYYRPPELLLGAKIYGCEVDIWSSACVFGEMLRGAVLFPGKNTFNQLELYIDCFGLPTDNDADSMNASKRKWKELKSILPNTKDCPAEAISILEQMLVYMPTRRLHGTQLLCDPFFKDLFDKNTRRPSGKPIGCLSSAVSGCTYIHTYIDNTSETINSVQDVNEVLSGDVSMTGSIQ
ncbi:kinase domain protein [Necator americanus]|uniref:Kinase domain protein n=1 Tax=Necator americanus TaxID=51031 RepID=W2THU7_NECAM|nr:kinase domain protein [Necator americanus]ETN80597.1 kinase domain protein [Necator americanus]